MSGDLHISSLIVQTRPEKLAAVRGAIETLGAEVPMDDPAGKLVVVIETSSEAAINGMLNAICVLDGVLSANLVYHLIDSDAPTGSGGSPLHSQGET